MPERPRDLEDYADARKAFHDPYPLPDEHLDAYKMFVYVARMNLPFMLLIGFDLCLNIKFFVDSGAKAFPLTHRDVIAIVVGFLTLIETGLVPPHIHRERDKYKNVYSELSNTAMIRIHFLLLTVFCSLFTLWTIEEKVVFSTVCLMFVVMYLKPYAIFRRAEKQRKSKEELKGKSETTKPVPMIVQSNTVVWVLLAVGLAVIGIGAFMVWGG